MGTRRVAIAVLLAYLALAVAIIAGTAILVARDRAQEVKRTGIELSSLARALDEHVSRSVGQVDTVLAALAGPINLYGGPDRIGDRALHQLAAGWSDKTPQAAFLFIAGPDGSLRATSRAYPAPQPAIDTGDLVARQGDATGMMIAAPRRDRGTGRWVVPVARRVLDADGSLVAVVGGALDPAWFEAFYRDTRLTPDDAISILDRSGRLLVRHPARDEQIGRDYSRNPALRQPAPHHTLLGNGVSWIDGQSRLWATRALGDYPLVVHVSRPETSALRAFHANTERLVWGMSMLCGVLGVLAWVVFENLRRRERARRTLHKLARSLEDRVQQRTAELENSNRELLAFSYSVSHDLRAPLRAINGFSHALLEDCADQLDAVGRDYLERVARASVRMGELIDELLKLANVARQPLDIAPLDLSAMAREIAGDLQAAAPDRAVRFDIAAGVSASADETLMRNVLANLLDNAWKFTRDRNPATIRFGATPPDTDGQEYFVADDGVGFDMMYAGRLFQPFQQLHGGQGYGGTGIGLASARRIIERHGGHIRAESAPGQGTTIYFRLPRPAAVIRKRRAEPQR